MHQEKIESAPSPFFELLSEAEEISVREVTGDKRTRNKREFIVFVTSPEPKKLETSLAEENQLPRNYLLENADVLLKDKDYLLARNIYSFLLKKDIRDREALRGLGICLLRIGEFTASRKCFRAFYELFKEEEGLFWLGLTESLQGNDAQAVEYLERVKNPEFLRSNLQFEFYKELGNVFTRVQKIEKAEACYKQAMNLDPSSDTIFVNLGTLSIQMKRYEAAHTHFVKAISLNPLNPRAYCGLGLAAIELGKNSLAERQFEKVLELDPQNVVALSHMMKVVSGDQKILGLRSRIERCLEKDRKNSDVRYLHAVCEFKLGRYHSCQREIEALLNDEPNHQAASRLREELSKHFKSLGGTA